MDAKDNAKQIEDINDLRLYGLVGDTELHIQFITRLLPSQKVKSFESQGLWIFCFYEISVLNINVINTEHKFFEENSDIQ